MGINPPKIECACGFGAVPKVRCIIALVITVFVGFASRAYPLGWYVYDKSLGDVLYAVAAYLGFALVFRHKPPGFIALAALLTCVAVEVFKLTGIPARYGQHVPPIAWLLGTTFSWHNIGCYAIGLLAIAGFDYRLLRRR